MQPPFLVFSVLTLLVGAALLVGAIAIGVWLKRMDRPRALKTYVWSCVSGAIAFLAVSGALLLTLVVESHDNTFVYREHHQGLVLTTVGLWLLAVCATGVCAFFGLWTLWRLVDSPQSHELHTTHAT